jgi:hypothetical protein
MSAEGGSRTNRFYKFSRCLLLSSSFLWLCIKYSCVCWLCFGVATFVASCYLKVEFIISLLHGIAWVLLHEHIIFTVKIACGGKLNYSIGYFSGAWCLH